VAWRGPDAGRAGLWPRTRIAIASQRDPTVVVDVRSGDEMLSLGKLGSLDAAWSPDGALFAGGESATGRITDWRDMTERWRDRPYRNQIEAAMPLLARLRHIVTWATKTIAHLDPTRPERVPTYHEVGDALDVLASVTRRYQSLLNQSPTVEWAVIIQGDWQAPFRPSLFPLPFSVYPPPLGGFT
jgi:hypothetical protein